MAEPAVVSEPVLLVAYDEWAGAVARMIARALGERARVLLNGGAREPAAVAEAADRARLAVLVTAGADAHAARLAAVRDALEERFVTHLTVRGEGTSVCVGPAVTRTAPGCHRCWEARRRQHGEVAAPSGADGDGARLGARAALAVIRRVTSAPGEESAVVRLFTGDGASPQIGRVIAVSGCARCDRPHPRPAGWSLRSRSTVGAPITYARREVKT